MNKRHQLDDFNGALRVRLQNDQSLSRRDVLEANIVELDVTVLVFPGRHAIGVAREHMS